MNSQLPSETSDILPFSESELKFFAESPEALALLMDQHDHWESCADAMDMATCANHHQKRRHQLRLAAGRALLKRDQE